jgi:sugar-specific transcriptional regulator TrmB
MILDKTLENFGLTEKEAKVYLAIISLGRDTVVSIAKKSELKRSTVYITLESLIKKGLARKIPKDTTTLYVAEDPNYLLNLLAEKEKSIKDVIPLLQAMYNEKKAKPQIKFYENADGIKKIYGELRQAKKYIYFYGSIKDIAKDFSAEMLSYQIVKQMGIEVREIMSSNSFDQKYAHELIAYKNRKHTVRLLRKGEFFPLDSAIVDDDKFFVMSLKENMFGIIIESKDIAQSFKLLYELAWQSAEVVK